MKFVDPTRQYFESKMPFRPIEIFVEKDAIRNFIARIAAKYHLSIQVLRGFASLSMYRKAIARAKKNGVRTILYLGDFDPSGLLIEKVAAKEMGIRFVRIAVTHEQIRRLKLQSIPVNRKDSRSKAYIPKYGRRVWEIESIRPRTLLRIIDEKLRMYVPEQFLEKTASREKASRLVQPIISSLAKRIMKDALSMKRHGLSDQEILRRISEKYR